MVIQVWSLLLLTRLSLAARIFLQPPLDPSNSIPTTVSPAHVQQILSVHLGLDMMATVGGEIAWRSKFVGQGFQKAMIMTMDEDIVAPDILPSNLHSSITLPPKTESSIDPSSLISSLVHRAQHVYTSIVTSTSSSPAPAVPRLLDIFTATSSASVETFLSETAALVYFIEESDQDTFGAFELAGLSLIANEHGRRSEQYKQAVDAMHAILSAALSNPKLTFAVLTTSSPTSSSFERNARAQPPPQSPFPIPTLAPQQPIGSVSTCHASADTCNNTTNSCSGRGECSQASKAGRTCFVCACNVTLDDQGRRQWWVGDACERKDISGPFVLITGTVITLILLIGGSISLLYSIGGQALPPTLMGGAAGGHLKRD